MHVMWFSGLRGGVAFAIAAVSYASHDFPELRGVAGTSGRFTPGKEQLTDSLAILQTTMLIAVFTIVVFGGSITAVCRAAGVLEEKGFKPVAGEMKGLAKHGHNYLLECLTWEREYIEDSGLRYGAALDGEPDLPAVSSAVSFEGGAVPASTSHLSMPHDNTLSMKKGIGSSEFEMALQGTGLDHRHLSVEDKIDAMREALPHLGKGTLKKLLDDAGGDEVAAIANGKAKVSGKELL